MRHPRIVLCARTGRGTIAPVTERARSDPSRASEERARRFFDAIAGRYERAYALPRDASRARMARVLRALPARARVLDLGVGTGRELSALLDAGHAPTGLDFAREMLALCKRRSRPVPLVEANFWDPLPFPSASFDAALALHGTLTHPPDDGALSRLAQDVARVLVPGGVLVAEVPALAWLDRLDATADGAGPADGPDRRARRTGADTFEYEDTVVHACIDARVLGPEAWRAALAPWLEASIEPLGEHEQLVVARAAG
jgi:SAM-dependent methyltransferase